MSQQQVKIVAGVPVYLDPTTGQFSATLGGKEIRRKDLRRLEAEIERARSWEGIKVYFTGYSEVEELRPQFVTNVDLTERYGARIAGVVDAWVLDDGQRVKYGTPRLWDDEIAAKVAALGAQIRALKRAMSTLVADSPPLTAAMVQEGRAAALGLDTTTEGEQH